MNDALLITLIGGGMVFVGLILLWWMMDLLVRFTAEKETPAEAQASISDAEQSENISVDKRKAAAAAVATILAMQRSAGSDSSLSAKDSVSPWSSIGRSRQINSTVSFSRWKKD
jgi:Na+-transporting methylmalonyl-CoA/oxaloacetate decarboxylase gamma subunit